MGYPEGSERLGTEMSRIVVPVTGLCSPLCSRDVCVCALHSPDLDSGDPEAPMSSSGECPTSFSVGPSYMQTPFLTSGPLIRVLARL